MKYSYTKTAILRFKGKKYISICFTLWYSCIYVQSYTSRIFIIKTYLLIALLWIYSYFIRCKGHHLYSSNVCMNIHILILGGRGNKKKRTYTVNNRGHSAQGVEK